MCTPTRSVPYFNHDCSSCVFLGNYNDPWFATGTSNGDCDLYYCPGQPTVLARFGNEGGEYSSGIPLKDNIAALGEAYQRASFLGYKVTRD